MICPSVNGGKNWPAGAYSPQTNAMYYPLQNMCMKVTTQDPDASLYALNMQPELAAGHRQGRHGLRDLGGNGTHDVEVRAARRHPVAGGDRRRADLRRRRGGHFRALDDASGKVLLDVNLGSPVSGYPITFAVAGKQYVAVSTGPSLVAGGVGRLTPELKPGSASQMFVFALPSRRSGSKD